MRLLLAIAIPVFGLSAIEVAAESLVRDFKNNILHFKKKYEEKILTVNGEAGGVAEHGESFVLWIDYKHLSSGYNDPLIKCVLASNSLDKASTLSKKQTVKVRGTISYEKEVTVAEIIIINDCEIQ